MRRIERIPIFLKLVDKKYKSVLTDGYKLDLDVLRLEHIVKDIELNKKKIKKFWLKNQDLRFCQALISLDLLPNFPGFWYYTEDAEILERLNVEPREYLLWTSNFDKDLNMLPAPIIKPIKDLDTDHIESIIDGKWCTSGKHFECFNEELKRRGVR